MSDKEFAFFAQDFVLSLNKLQYADRVRIFVLEQQHHRRCQKANTWGRKKGKAWFGTTIQKMQAYCRRKRGIFRICLPSKNCFAFPISSNGTYINRFRRREREKIEALEGKVLETSIQYSWSLLLLLSAPFSVQKTLSSLEISRFQLSYCVQAMFYSLQLTSLQICTLGGVANLDQNIGHRKVTPVSPFLAELGPFVTKV